MKLWRFVNGEDLERDLTSEPAGRVWGEPRAHAGGYESVRYDRVTMEEKPRVPPDWFESTWCRNVRVMRSLVGRLVGERTRRPGIKPLEADRVLAEYLELPVRVELNRPWPADPPGRKGRSGLPDVRDPDRVMERIKRYTDRLKAQAKTPLARESVAGLKLRSHPDVEPLHGYWQDVFLSLLDDRHAGVKVCEKCRRPLPPTDGGKPSQRVVCKSCQNRDWYAKADPEVVRERRKQYKAEQRKREKEGG